MLYDTGAILSAACELAFVGLSLFPNAEGGLKVMKKTLQSTVPLFLLTHTEARPLACRYANRVQSSS